MHQMLKIGVRWSRKHITQTFCSCSSIFCKVGKQKTAYIPKRRDAYTSDSRSCSSMYRDVLLITVGSIRYIAKTWKKKCRREGILYILKEK